MWTERQHDAPDPEGAQGQDHLVVEESRPARRENDGSHQRRHDDQRRAYGEPGRPGKERRLAAAIEYEAKSGLPADPAKSQQDEGKNDR